MRIRTLILPVLAALALTACATPGGAPDWATDPPAPLDATTADEKALTIAYETFDTVLTAVDALVANGILVRNSPRALEVQRYLTATKRALNAASAARRAGSARDYATALSEASDALGQARGVLAVVRR